MSLFEDYATSPEAEKNGVRVQFTDFWIQCARAGGANKQYEKELERAMRPHRHASDTGKLSEDVARGVLKEVYAKTIVKAWGGDGLKKEDGSDWGPCTAENVLALFKHPKLDYIFDQVYATAKNVNRYLETEVAADLGNSQPS